MEPASMLRSAPGRVFLLAPVPAGASSDETVPRARQQRWRIDVQRQLGNDMVVSVGYAGSFADQIRVVAPA